MLIACLGQSNMKEWFFTGKDLKAHSLLRKFSGTGWSKLTVLGNAAIAFGNRIIDRLQIPVGLLDFQPLDSNHKIRLVIGGSLDDIAPIKLIEEKMLFWNPEATLHIVEGADHFYQGKIFDLTAFIDDFLGKSDD